MARWRNEQSDLTPFKATLPPRLPFDGPRVRYYHSPKAARAAEKRAWEEHKRRFVPQREAQITRARKRQERNQSEKGGPVGAGWLSDQTTHETENAG